MTFQQVSTRKGNVSARGHRECPVVHKCRSPFDSDRSAIFAQGRLSTRSLRELAQDDRILLGSVMSYPFAESAKGWGTELRGLFPAIGLIHEVHLRNYRDHAALMAKLKQLANGLSAVGAVVEGALVHIHAHKAAGQVCVEVARK